MTDISSTRFGLFRSHAGNLALAADKLIQIQERPKLFRIPGAPDFVLGGTLLQNQVVPVLQLGTDPEGETSPAFVALCGTTLGPVGFSCAEVGQLVAASDGEFEPAAADALPWEPGRFFYLSEAFPLIDVDLLVENLPE